MKPPIFSIIIPHRNTPLLLRRLLESVPRRDDTEVIVVDDCSLPAVQAQLSEVEKDFPAATFIPLDSRGGAGAARNAGIDRARGRYLIFADADDFFLPELDGVLDDYANSDHDIVFCNATSVNSDTLLPADRAEYFPRILDRYLSTLDPDDIRVAFAVPWGRLISRQLVVDNSIRFEQVAVSNDMMFSTLTGIAASYIAADRRPVYCATRRPGSLSTSLTRDDIITRLQVKIRCNEQLTKAGLARLIDDPTLLHYFIEIDRARIKGLKRQALSICRQAGYNTRLINRRLRIFKLRSFLHNLLTKLSLK